MNNRDKILADAFRKWHENHPHVWEEIPETKAELFNKWLEEKVE